MQKYPFAESGRAIRRLDTLCEKLASLNAAGDDLHHRGLQVLTKWNELRDWAKGEAKELAQRRTDLGEIQTKMKVYHQRIGAALHDFQGAVNARRVMQNKASALVEHSSREDSLDLTNLGRLIDRANAALAVEHGRMQRAAKIFNDLDREFDRVLASVKKGKAKSR
jgi:hypothetical protein